MAKKSYADRIREKQHKKAKEAASRSGGDPREWTPTEGTYRIRVLPPVEIVNENYETELKAHKKNPKKNPKPKKSIEDDFFYMTHAYHFLDGVGNEGRGTLLWTPRTFNVDGESVKDPIDEAVAQLYETARREKNDEMKGIAGKIKRKRQYFANIILYTDEGMEYRILKDTTNEGKLIQQLCMHMGFPFYRDVQDEWVVKESLELDEDRDYFDLIDIEAGHDFKIKREKTGDENWDISYQKSIPLKKPRTLTEEEMELLEERTDLRNLVDYCNYETAKECLESYFDEEDDIAVDDGDDEELKEKAKKLAKKSKKSRPTPKEEVEDDENEEEEEEEGIDGLLDELDDEDEEWDEEAKEE